ncbi:MAG: FkbM family methyltransferase [Bradyrhizobium sp.]|uniref:FkbM family methyltransferase n=1 Tax=Bradyrhizobium sp. TaxID=376 RepID=UPI0027185C78|nr:FkbM family methyltransferase [Bradyrhizobium sp.]MDO9563871.1 FkbM family methyltransferase [Bradyrhizobium sp.]MDP3689433.1 FkbM family methyltransferase [Bradyrhizobium sp.]
MTEESSARERESVYLRDRQTGPLHRAAGRQDLRTRIITRGVRAVCGPSTTVPTTAAANIPLFSAGLRFVWLKLLGAVGIKNFVARSGLGYDFVCHVGDLSEHPFYHRRANENELALCAAWLQDESEPVVLDVGANVGFVSTQLAQMLAARSPTIYAFEPVPATFTKLEQSVRALGLNDRVQPVAAAVLDEPRQVCLSYSLKNSLYAQITPGGLNPRAGDHLAHAQGVTLDAFCAQKGIRPALLKIDVEGSEVAVLRGASRLLSGSDRPAILIEYNPLTLSECGATGGSLSELLAGYSLYYVDDLEGQALPFGSPVYRIEEITWICNLFAVPEDSLGRWASALNRAVHRLEA